MFTPFVYAASVALLSLRSLVYASPHIARESQGVWNPPITAPREGDVWTVGSTQLVTWDTHRIPPSAMNSTGTLLLGYFDGTTHGENLNTYHPLADDFLLTDGCVRVQVPDVKPRDTYIVVLMGNSGNASPEFTITNASKSGKTHNSFNQGVSQKGSGNPGSKQFPPDLAPAPPSPPPPDHLVPSPQIDPIDTEPLPVDVPASTLCNGRHSGSRNGSTWSSAHNPASGEGHNEHC